MSKGFKYPAPPAAVPDLHRPNFGSFEDDIATTHIHLKMAEVERGHKMTGVWPFREAIPDLRRPNYGDKDVEIDYTHKNIANAEKRLKTKLKASFGKPAPIPDLRRPNFGNFDADIQTSINNAKLASKEVKGKSFVQLDAQLESDPVCSSAGCVQYLHPKAKGDGGNGPLYKIAPDGPDPDMVATQKSIAIAESLYRHKWDFGTARSKALKKYHNVAKDTLYDFNMKLDPDVIDTQKHLADTEKRLNHKWVYAQLDSDINIDSDPVCSSISCFDVNPYRKAIEDNIVQYPDPAQQGLDHDILDTLSNEKKVSDRLLHTWNVNKSDVVPETTR